MKKLFALALLASALLSLNVAQAQTDPAPAETTSNNIIVSESSSARLSLQTQLHSKLNEVGDQVVAVLYEPVRASDGRLAIPRGTEFIGRITQVQAAKRPQKEATMTVVFEKCICLMASKTFRRSSRRLTISPTTKRCAPKMTKEKSAADVPAGVLPGMQASAAAWAVWAVC